MANNRIIKFRGKTEDGKWVFGSYHYCTGIGLMRSPTWKDGGRSFDDKEKTFDSHWILEHHTPSDIGWEIGDTYLRQEVIPESVSQFTGEYTEDKTEIWEGDKVEYEWYDRSVGIWERGVGVVEFKNGGFTPLPGYNIRNFKIVK